MAEKGQKQFSVEKPYFVTDKGQRGLSAGLSVAVGFSDASDYMTDVQGEFSDYGFISMENIAPGGTYQFGNGTVSKPSIAFQADPDTGFYRIGAGNIGMTLDGTKRLDFGTSRTTLSLALELGDYAAVNPTGVTDGDIWYDTTFLRLRGREDGKSKNLGPTIVDASGFAGTNFGAKLQAAHDDLGAAGGVIDCRSLVGAQSSTAKITLSKPVEVWLGEMVLTVSTAYPAIHVTVDGVSIIGAGQDITVIQSAGTGTQTPIIRSTKNRTTIKRLQIKYTSGNAANVGINFLPLVDSVEHVIEHVRFTGVSSLGFGLHLEQAVYTSSVRDCVFNGWGDGVRTITGTDTGNGVTFRGCHFESNATGLYTLLADTLMFHGCVFENNTTRNMRIGGGTVFINQCHLENGTVENVLVEGGNHFFSNSAFGISATDKAVVNSGTGKVTLSNCDMYRGTSNNSTGEIIWLNCNRQQNTFVGGTRIWSSTRCLDGITSLATTTDADTSYKMYGWDFIQFGGTESIIGDINATLNIITSQTGTIGNRAKPIQFLNSSGSAIGEIGGLGRCQFGNLELIPKLSDTPTNILDCQDGAGNVVLRARRDNRRVAVGTGVPSGDFSVVQVVQTATNQNAFNVLGAAHTTLAASTEAIDVNIDMARTVQFATGAITTQRAVLFQAPTYGFVAASTITDAATVAISAAPAAGTNATITNAYALWIQAGGARFGSWVRGGTATDATTTGSFAFGLLNAGRIWYHQGNNILTITGSNNVDTVALKGVATNLFTVLQPDLTSGTPRIFWIIAGSHTGMTASTEHNEIYYNLSTTKQWNTGAITTQRAFRIEPPTYGFVGASTITDAATLAIAGDPVAGANATITNAYALWAQGNARINTALRVGTALDTATAGDAVFGLTGAARAFFDQSAAQVIMYNSSGIATITLSSRVAGTSGTSGDFAQGQVVIRDRGDAFGTQLRFAPGTPKWDVYCVQASGILQFQQVTNAAGTSIDLARVKFENDGSVSVAQWLNGGTATDASAQGDLAFGLTGAPRWFYDQSVPSESQILANGQKLAFSSVTELTTIAAAATTDTAIQIPLDAVALAVSARVTVAIPTAVTFTVTGTTSATQFDVAGGVSVAVDTTDVGTRNCPYKNGAAQTIRITPSVVPATNAGRVRVTVWYYQSTAPTS